jgi:hypothetical protein
VAEMLLQADMLAQDGKRRVTGTVTIHVVDD